MSIRSLVENKSTLDYKTLTLSLIQEIGINETVNWDAVIPAAVQQNLFGGEILRLFSDHESFANQKDIRTIALKKGETSQLLILFAQLKDEKLSKANIERVTKKFIGGQAAERYVVWFLGNLDNTQFKVVLSGKEGKKIVLKTLPFGIYQPYYKTYDFILDEVHKKVSGFFVEPNELWKALWKSFDISVVNKRFYEDIKKSFDLLVNNNILSGAIRNIEARKQFVVRLIGRIIFCWFLKKKTIIDEVVLCSSAVNKYEDYYGQFLEKLFFDVFNTPQKERRKDLPEEIKNYPFLNGGLFEDQKGDFGDYKGYINIPNEWFEDIFKNTLEKYNFTIDENTSANSEIAIDPEMLGRIFENLLAEQNPETQESARKSTGSYYTPREIVDYMVEQSVIEYLKSNSESPLLRGDLGVCIEDFVHTEELTDELKPYTNDILEKLNSVKVLDPACGSGAFPIGMLQKLIALKLQLSPLSKSLSRDFGGRGTQGGSKGVYELKLSTILNSIYGCDIQPMAVELSRLRCWLSLIIDEPVDKKKDNWGIENLPNLDFKFVCVNTLISLPKMTEDSLGTSADDFEKLKDLRTEFFSASATRKIKIENEFKQLQEKIAEKHREWSTKNTEAVLMLTNWNPFEVDETNWFDPFWMFGVNEGFDVVIGNPPYGAELNFSNNDFKKAFKYYDRQKNSASFFIEKTAYLINPKGNVTLIIPKSLSFSEGWSDTRNLISQQLRLILVVDVSKAFENVLLEQIIISFTPGKSSNKYLIKVGEGWDNTIVEFGEVSSSLISHLNILPIYIDVIKLRIYNKLQSDSVLLDSISDTSRGLPFQKRISKKGQTILRGKNIQRYSVSGKIDYIQLDREEINNKKIKSILNKKIVSQNIVAHIMNPYDHIEIIASLDSEGLLSLDTVMNTFIESKEFLYEYILAVLNSKLGSWFYYWFVYNRSIRTMHFDKYYIGKLPIRNITITIQKFFSNLVVAILESKKINPQANTEHLEDQIDIMVYKLYNLTYEEVKIIDPNIEQIINNKDYEKFELRE